MATSGPSRIRSGPTMMAVADGCQGRAVMIASTAIAAKAAMTRRRLSARYTGAYEATTAPSGAQILPGLAGWSACKGEISSVTARVNAAKIPTTAIGARRRATRDRSVSPCAASSTHASPSGSAGHHDQPISVTAVSSTTKDSAIVTSTRTTWRRSSQSSLLMRQWYVRPFRPAAKTQPSAGSHPTKVAWPQEVRSLRWSRTHPSALPPRGVPAVQFLHARESTRGRTCNDHNHP